MLIDGYVAAYVLIPQVQIERQWPGGPVIGRDFWIFEFDETGALVREPEATPSAAERA